MQNTHSIRWIFSFIVRVIKVITKLNVTYCVIIYYASDCCLIVLDTETRINFNLNRNVNEIELSYEKKMFVQKISVILNCVVQKGAMFCSNCILELQTKFFKCFKRICSSINLVKCAWRHLIYCFHFYLTKTRYFFNWAINHQRY